MLDWRVDEVQNYVCTKLYRDVQRNYPTGDRISGPTPPHQGGVYFLPWHSLGTTRLRTWGRSVHCLFLPRAQA